jgi:hypothetical protein
MYCHTLYSFRPRLPPQEDSDTVTCLMTSDPASIFGRAPTPPDVLMTLDPASLLRRASAPSRALQLRTLPPYSGGLRRYHVSHGSHRATDLRNKERPS